MSFEAERADRREQGEVEEEEERHEGSRAEGRGEARMKLVKGK